MADKSEILQKELGIYKQLLAQANANMATTVADLTIKLETLHANIETINKLRDTENGRSLDLENKLIKARLANSALSDELAEARSKIPKSKGTEDLLSDDSISFEFNVSLERGAKRKRNNVWSYTSLPYSDVVFNVIDIFNDSYTALERNEFFNNLKTFN